MLEYLYLDFIELMNKISKRKMNLNLNCNEEMWFKFLSFLSIAVEISAGDEIEIPSVDYFLSRDSLKSAERIRCKFNEKFYQPQSITLLDIAGGIQLKYLIEFAKTQEALI